MDYKAMEMIFDADLRTAKNKENTEPRKIKLSNKSFKNFISNVRKRKYESKMSNFNNQYEDKYNELLDEYNKIPSINSDEEANKFGVRWASLISDLGTLGASLAELDLKNNQRIAYERQNKPKLLKFNISQLKNKIIETRKSKDYQKEVREIVGGKTTKNIEESGKIITDAIGNNEAKRATEEIIKLGDWYEYIPKTSQVHKELYGEEIQSPEEKAIAKKVGENVTDIMSEKATSIPNVESILGSIDNSIAPQKSEETVLPDIGEPFVESPIVNNTVEPDKKNNEIEPKDPLLPIGFGHEVSDDKIDKRATELIKYLDSTLAPKIVTEEEKDNDIRLVEPILPINDEINNTPPEIEPSKKNDEINPEKPILPINDEINLDGSKEDAAEFINEVEKMREKVNTPVALEPEKSTKDIQKTFEEELKRISDEYMAARRIIEEEYQKAMKNNDEMYAEAKKKTEETFKTIQENEIMPTVVDEIEPASIDSESKPEEVSFDSAPIYSSEEYFPKGINHYDADISLDTLRENQEKEAAAEKAKQASSELAATGLGAAMRSDDFKSYDNDPRVLEEIRKREELRKLREEAEKIRQEMANIESSTVSYQQKDAAGINTKEETIGFPQKII